MLSINSTRSFHVTTASFLLCLAAAASFAQRSPAARNNPYSPSPAGNVAPSPSGKPQREITVAVNQDQGGERPSIAQRTYAIAKAAVLKNRPPVEVYNIGVGDVLFVNLKNSSQGSGYYTVHADGTIDYPLAGDIVNVSGQTVEEVEEMLASNIFLYPNPQVEVKVREYTSHKISVSGMVNAPGEKNLQRDAVPLYVIAAEAQVDRAATKAVVTHSQKPTSYDLRNGGIDNVLAYPGDSIEFTNETGNRDNAGYYFIGGNVLSTGQKPLSSGLTLYQAIIASGVAKGDVKRAVIRRKNEKGVFAVSEHNIQKIRDGKAVDPVLAAGDVVEVRK